MADRHPYFTEMHRLEMLLERAGTDCGSEEPNGAARAALNIGTAQEVLRCLNARLWNELARDDKRTTPEASQGGK